MARDDFLSDLCLAETEGDANICAKYSTNEDGHWHLWETLCTSLDVNPYLHDIPNKLPFLKVLEV
jgi:hypothetical protein